MQRGQGRGRNFWPRGRGHFEDLTSLLVCLVLWFFSVNVFRQIITGASGKRYHVVSLDAVFDGGLSDRCLFVKLVASDEVRRQSDGHVFRLGFVHQLLNDFRTFLIEQRLSNLTKSQTGWATQFGINEIHTIIIIRAGFTGGSGGSTLLPRMYNPLLIFVNRFRGSILTPSPSSTLPDVNSTTVTLYRITCQRRSSLGAGPAVKTQKYDSPLRKFDKYSPYNKRYVVKLGTILSKNVRL